MARVNSADIDTATYQRKLDKNKVKKIAAEFDERIANEPKEEHWLPSYMDGYESLARPFWKFDVNGKKVGDYSYIKEVLGF